MKLRRVLEQARTGQRVRDRIRAVSSLAGQANRADVRRVLVECLEDTLVVAEEAMRILLSCGDELVWGDLVSAYMRSKDPYRKIMILERLSKAPQTVLAAFLKGSRVLAASDERLRATAISMLGKLENQRLKTLFIKALADPCSRVRANAVEALGLICGAAEQVKLFRPLLCDQSNRVRANAICLLMEADCSWAERHLEGMLTHPSARFRASAAWVLGRVARARRHFGWLNTLLGDMEAGVVERAEGSLVRLGRCWLPVAA